MRGVINVVAAQPQTLTVQATSGGFTGKQSSFLLFQCHHYRRSFFSLYFSSNMYFSIYIQFKLVHSMYNRQ